MRKTRIAATLSLVAFNVLIFSYAYIVLADIRISPLNPRDPEYTIPIPSRIWLEKSVGPVDILVGLNVTYQGTLTTSTPMTLRGHGLLSTNSSLAMVKSVEVAFWHALKFPLEYEYGSAISGGLVLSRQGSELVGTMAKIIEVVPGDYPVVWLVNFLDDSSRIYQFPDSSIHVEPAYALVEERFNRVNQGLTIALLGFSSIESVLIVCDVWQRGTERRQ